MAAAPLATDTLLAFDTSTETLSLAVHAGTRRWCDNRAGGAAASATLIPAAQALLQQAGCALSDVAAIAFGRGPGAFTGLRTSCAVAQGLAFGLQCPVLAIDSLMLVAEQARQRAGGLADGFELAVAMDARMGEVYAARYRWQQGDWQPVQAPGLWSPPALADDWAAAPPQAATGTALAMSDLLRAVPTLDSGDDRAAALIELAQRAWLAGCGQDAAQALPLYIRDKVAQTTAEREAARAAA